MADHAIAGCHQREGHGAEEEGHREGGSHGEEVERGHRLVEGVDARGGGGASPPAAGGLPREDRDG